MATELLQAILKSRVAILFTLGGVTALIAAAVVRLIPWALFFVTVVLGAVGLVAWGFVRQWWAARKDRALEAGLDAQSARLFGKARVRDREALKELQTKWKDSVETLRRSRIGKQKRWLYRLPWYVIIGAPACGKSTAINSSGLKFPIGTPKLGGTGGTRNCDWWFAEEAIILDTAGRYTFGDENEPDRDEWLEFLKMLKKYRPLAPINGLIVAVAADGLVGKESDAIVDDARNIRHKVDQLVTQLGIQFPIYLLITKCDLIEGFTDFFGRLPKRRLDEMLGWTNPSWEMADPQKLVADALAGLRERVVAMRPGFMVEEERPDQLRNVYLFPEELRAFERSLGDFCDVLFRETQYNEAPFLRGIYLTSGLQKGTAISKFLERLGVRAQASELREEKKSYFLKDFFQTRLPTDRNLVAATGRSRGRLQVVHNVALAAVAAACVLVAVVTGGSYVANRTLLLQVEDAVREAVSSQSLPPAQQVAALGRYVDALERLEDRNGRRPTSAGWGLYMGYRALAPARTLFLSRFDRDAYAPATTAARRAVRERDPDADFAGLDALIKNYVLSRQLNGSTTAPLGPNDGLAAFWAGKNPTTEEMLEQYGRGYVAFLRWRDPAAAKSDQTSDLTLIRDALPDMFTVPTVAAWADRAVKPVRAQDLPAPPEIAGDAAVRGAFTPQAWNERVLPLVTAVGLMADEKGAIDPAVPEAFRREYLARYFDAWFKFITAVKDVPESGLAPAVLLGERTPYLAAVDRTTDAGKIEIDDKERPPWMQTVSRVDGERAGYLGQLQAIGRAVRGAEQDPTGALEDAKQIYVRRVSATVDLGDDSTTPPDVFGKAERWVLKTVAKDGAADADDGQVHARLSALLRAPVYEAFGSYTGIVRQEINREWRRRIVDHAGGGDDVESLCAKPGGSLWVFAQEFLDPFFEQPDWVAKVRYTKKIPVTVNLGTLFKRCGQKGGGGAGGGGAASYPLFFESVPTADPGEGALRVTRTSLAIYCGDEPWVLEHRQFRVKKQLAAAERCQRTELTVWVGSSAGDDRPLDPLVTSGKRAVLNLLRLGTRHGDEFSWKIGSYTATFIITGADALIASRETGFIPASL